MLTFAASFTGDDRIVLKRCFTYFCYKWKLFTFLVISFQSFVSAVCCFRRPKKAFGPSHVTPRFFVAIEISRENRHFWRSLSLISTDAFLVASVNARKF